MLETGMYPPYLKKRISCGTGHLSNRLVAGFLEKIYTEQLQDIWLCHLSNDNNHPYSWLFRGKVTYSDLCYPGNTRSHQLGGYAPAGRPETYQQTKTKRNLREEKRSISIDWDASPVAKLEIIPNTPAKIDLASIR